MVRISLAVFLCGCCGPFAWGQAADKFSRLRDYLVDHEIVAAGISDPRVIEVMRRVPRHEFVSGRQQRFAYFDMAMPIGYGQTISPPYVVAYMTEKLAPEPTDRVLEVGTGSGYQAAVLSGLVKDVYTIEIVEALGRSAAARLRQLKYDNVHTKIGDGYEGWPEHAPFNKIIVTCSPEKIPVPLIDQLAEGGRMVIPIGERFQQSLYLLKKTKGQLEREALESTFFVPMTGTAEDQRDVLPDPENPRVAHGGFETSAAEEGAPAGWFYLRQGRMVSVEDAPEGAHCMVFDNTTPGRKAHAMQAISSDGRKLKRLEVSCWVRGEDIVQGQDGDQRANLIIEFYGANRAPVGHRHVGPWTGTFAWKQERATIRVPRNARLAVIGIGLFGATGSVAFDQIDVKAAD
jgi:protein-L-isoaspartate(D-aspartate) O-methyltransferase